MRKARRHETTETVSGLQSICELEIRLDVDGIFGRSGRMSMHSEIEKVLDEVKRRIVPKFHPQRIILFGSYAEGRPGPDSDLDLLIVMEVEGSTRQKANEIDMLLADRSVPMDVIVLTPEQYERQKNIAGSIARQVEREGKVIYEHAA
jgi:predicted nucleotidyltransferase